MHRGLETVKGQLGRTLSAGHRRQEGDDARKRSIRSTRRTSEVVGRVAKATPEQAKQAIAAAAKAFDVARYVDPAKRAEYLFKAADIIRKRRFELAAWEVRRVGKPWREADADVAEAIDFLRVLRPRGAAAGRAAVDAMCPARTTTTSTSRAAWRSSSPRGTSRWRSSAA